MQIKADSGDAQQGAMQRRLDALQAEIEALKNQLKAAQEGLPNKEKALAAATDKNDDLQARVQQLEAQVRDQQAQLDSRTSEALQQREKASADANQLASKVKELEGQLKAAKDRNDALEREVRDGQLRLQALQGDADREKARADENDNKAADRAKDLAAANSKVRAGLGLVGWGFCFQVLRSGFPDDRHRSLQISFLFFDDGIL